MGGEWVAALLVFTLASPGLGSTNTVVFALGKLQPAGGIVRVAAPYSLQGPSLIAELMVKEGDKVSAGQLLARTHMHRTATAALAHAEAEVAVREARLEVVKSGLKPGELAALAAEAERERADLAEAAQLLRRSERLLRENTISSQEHEAALARWLATSNRVVAASERLAAGAEVRSVDVNLALAQIEEARAVVERARRELEQTEVRAPIPGEVIDVHAKVGEIAAGGVLDLGRTDSMEVIAEVYESEIRHLEVNQTAEIRGDAFDNALSGRVIRIARQVRPNRLLSPDPAFYADNRVVEVTVQIEAGARVAGLSGAMVNVRFSPR